MAENPHDLEKQIRGLGLTDLIASGEGTIVDKISQLKFDYNTGNSQALHAIEKTLKEYNKSLANIAGEGLVRTGLYKTDTLGAGFLPATITGFFNSATNERLFKFFSEANSAMLYGFRKINPDYTGYACRVRRMYDLAMADVKFDANGIVSPSSEVDLAYTGFGTGLTTEEETFSGFCHPSYLPNGMTDSEYSTTTIAKLYSQADGPDFTGEFELSQQDLTYTARPEGPTMASGENFDLDVNGAQGAYSSFLETDQFSGASASWKILKGTGLPVGVGGRNIMFPIYVKDRPFRTLQVMYPINYTATGNQITATGIRWTIRDEGTYPSNFAPRQNWSEIITHFNRSTLFDDDTDAFANQLITSDSTNRPYEFTSWSLREVSAINSNAEFVYYVNKLNNQPIIATGATKMFYDEGTNRLGMKFNAEGNASVLHNANNYINLGSEASVGFVVRTDKTGENQTVFSQGEQENVLIEGPADSHDGAYLTYGLHYHLSQYAWKGQFYDHNDDIKTSLSNLDGVTPMIPNSGRDTNTHFIQMHVSATASSSSEGSKGILEFDGVRSAGTSTPDGSQAFVNNSTRIGARLDNGGTLTEGLDGTIYEMIFFRNDSQLDQDELNRYRPNVVDYHDITLQNE